MEARHSPALGSPHSGSGIQAVLDSAAPPLTCQWVTPGESAVRPVPSSRGVGGSHLTGLLDDRPRGSLPRAQPRPGSAIVNSVPTTLNGGIHFIQRSSPKPSGMCRLCGHSEPKPVHLKLLFFLIGYVIAQVEWEEYEKQHEASV